MRDLLRALLFTDPKPGEDVNVRHETTTNARSDDRAYSRIGHRPSERARLALGSLGAGASDEDVGRARGGDRGRGLTDN